MGEYQLLAAKKFPHRFNGLSKKSVRDNLLELLQKIYHKVNRTTGTVDIPKEYATIVCVKQH